MHTHVFVAGTFDHLHNGHKAVLDRAVIEGEKVTIGITTDEFLHAYKSYVFDHAIPPQTFNERKHGVHMYIESLLKKDSVSYIAVDSPYSPADTDASYDAIIVTEDNKQTGEEINTRRKEHQLEELSLIVVDEILADDGQQISSSRIRLGQINTVGNLLLPDSMRESLKDPFGDVYPHGQESQAFQHSEGQYIITVGDMTTLHARNEGILPHLSVIDFLVERKPFKEWEEFHFPKDIQHITLESGPGFIAKEIWEILTSWTAQRNPTVIEVHGEDDLLVLPIILTAPLDSLLFYGQPGEGIVRVKVTDHVKDSALNLLQGFTVE